MSSLKKLGDKRTQPSAMCSRGTGPNRARGEHDDVEGPEESLPMKRSRTTEELVNRFQSSNNVTFCLDYNAEFNATQVAEVAASPSTHRASRCPACVVLCGDGADEEDAVGGAQQELEQVLLQGGASFIQDCFSLPDLQAMHVELIRFLGFETASGSALLAELHTNLALHIQQLAHEETGKLFSWNWARCFEGEQEWSLPLFISKSNFLLHHVLRLKALLSRTCSSCSLSQGRQAITSRPAFSVPTPCMFCCPTRGTWLAMSPISLLPHPTAGFRKWWMGTQ